MKKHSGFSRSLAVVSALLFIAALSGCGSKQSGDDVSATVDGQKIFRTDVEKYYQNQTSGSEQQPVGEQATSLRLSILRELIDNEILMRRAGKLGLLATDEEVERKLNEIKSPYSNEEFDARLKEKKISLDDFKRDLRRSLTVEKVLNKEVTSKINVSDQDITDYYNAHKAEFNLIEPQYHLAQIAVTNGPAAQTGNLQNNKALGDTDAKKKIQELHARLAGGQDFGAIASNFSENPSTASNGGDMGFISETQLRAEQDVYNAVGKLKPGEITDILPVYDSAGPSRRVMGYAIFKLIAREPAGQRELADPRVQQVIRQGLREGHTQLLQNAYFEMLHNDAKVHNYFAEQILKQGGAQ